MAIPSIKVGASSVAGQDVLQRVKNRLGYTINSGVAGLDVALVVIVAAIAWIASRR